MRAAFDDTAMVEHHDHVGIAHGGQAVHLLRDTASTASEAACARGFYVGKPFHLSVPQAHGIHTAAVAQTAGR